jgi:DNA-binding transcriptional MerR regulator
MDEDLTGGPIAEPSGWVNTKVAARALGVDPRTVRKYIKQGKLEAKVQGEGVEKTYLIPIASVHALRLRTAVRPCPDQVRESDPRESAGSAISEDLVVLVRELSTEARNRSSEAAELRTRLELTEQAESSRREALEQRIETERLRREQAERERDEIAARLAELETASGPPEEPETVTEEPEGVEIPLGEERRPWWQRWFGG